MSAQERRFYEYIMKKTLLLNKNFEKFSLKVYLFLSELPIRSIKQKTLNMTPFRVCA
jgi:hypothetical protein